MAEELSRTVARLDQGDLLVAHPGELNAVFFLPLTFHSPSYLAFQTTKPFPRTTRWSGVLLFPRRFGGGSPHRRGARSGNRRTS